MNFNFDVCCCWFFIVVIVHLHRQQAGCEAAPTAPDLRNCHSPSDVPAADLPLQCCPPGLSASTPTPRLFRPTPPSSLRLRRPAHLASAAYAEQLARGYALMKALPTNDPRSFSHQANIHCAYCNSAYNQLNSSQLLQAHGCWLFGPFHRWYLFFHERILARLLGDDDTFALPFWNYDHPNASDIPWLFRTYNDTLVSSYRDPLHNLPTSTVAIDSAMAGDDRTREQQLQANAFAMQRALVRDASTQDGFFGLPLRQGDDPNPGGGSLENIPHNAIHMWLGNKSAVGFKDMGALYSAARDPVFYAHHAQLDRLWEVWKTLPDHQDIADEDYLNSELIFYTEDAELVRVKVSDSLNATALGYAYEEVETPWMDAVPERCSSGVAVLSPNSTICATGQPLLVPCSVVVERPDECAGEGGDTLELSRVLDMLKIDLQVDTTRVGSHMDVYVNLPDANASTSPACMEMVGSYESFNPAATLAAEKYTNMTAILSLYGRLVELNLTGQSSVVITLVPFIAAHSSLAAPSEPLSFEACSIYNRADTAAAVA